MSVLERTRQPQVKGGSLQSVSTFFLSEEDKNLQLQKCEGSNLWGVAGIFVRLVGILCSKLNDLGWVFFFSP